ncbi:MAG: DedA family protein [Gemmatimonadetes bacterium]|nr:DedA family protein [Gemmatimonadota bacterium]MBI2614519.1 DedA family protein [Gemmatimonadota bacterium]MBI3082703.1 DedA family protein [Gemmatimonadota bacterium]
MVSNFINWLVETIFQLGYPGIVLLMAVESSFFPLPSELIMPPAGYLAAQGRMNAAWAVVAGTAGSVLGALFNYFLAQKLGRPLLYRYHRYLLVSLSSLERSEAFFRRHGEIGTFLSRLLPVVRHLVSLPAGLAHMRLDRFVGYTAAGAALWCVILTAIGWYVGRHAAELEREVVQRYSTVATLVLLPAMAVAIAIYVLRRRRQARSGA